MAITIANTGRSIKNFAMTKLSVSQEETPPGPDGTDRKSTRLNSSHLGISYAVFCLKKDDNLYEEIMPYLKKANFTGVGFGMETAVERVAQVIVKNESFETHKKPIMLAR